MDLVYWYLFGGCGIIEKLVFDFVKEVEYVEIIDDVFNLNLILFIVLLEILVVWMFCDGVGCIKKGCCIVIFGDMLEFGL